MSSEHRYLHLFSRLFDAFSHRVRNSLNVISNELNFLQGHAPSDDLARAGARCREIQELLKMLALGDLASGMSECRLRELCAQISAHCEIPDVVIMGPTALLRRAFRELGRSTELLGIAASSVEMTQDTLRLSFTGLQEPCAENSLQTDSLSALLITRLGKDDPSSALFDLLWWSLGGTIEVICKDGTVSLFLTIPSRFECSQ